MKSKCIKRETLIDGSEIVIVKTTFSDWKLKTAYSCYVIPIQQHSEPEIILQKSTLEKCELAFIEELENDLCDIN